MAIITISREMGTGAYQIAKEVSKKLRYTLIDGAKITSLAAKHGLTAEIVERVDEKPPAYVTAEDRLQAANLNTVELILLECVREGNVIVYGRGGQDLLKGMHNVLRVRFIAPFDERVENFAEREWIDPDLAREMIRKSDHQRGGFIHFYFDRDWNDPLGYDLVFNTSRLSSTAIVESIVSAAKDPRLKHAESEASVVLEDIILCKRAETEMLRSPDISTTHFKYEANEGILVLSGHVHSEEERTAAVSVAQSIQGIKDLEDRLQVMNYRKHK